MKNLKTAKDKQEVDENLGRCMFPLLSE